jgi:hypothetical protein
MVKQSEHTFQPYAVPVATLLSALHDRWMDEREYEDFNEYKRVFSERVAKDHNVTAFLYHNAKRARIVDTRACLIYDFTVTRSGVRYREKPLDVAEQGNVLAG